MTVHSLSHYSTPLKLTLVILICLFAISLFKHLSYPLLWNDEAETVMYATRILRYGYPQIDDGHNYLYQLKHPDTSLGIQPTTGAYIGTTWGHFYFATIGVALANHVTDIYTKTALIRLPFAIIGFLAVLLYPLPFVLLLTKRYPLDANHSQPPLRSIRLAPLVFRSRKRLNQPSANHQKTLLGLIRIIRSIPPTFYLFLISYLLLELLSISLVLHLREVRYYSLSLFLYATFTYLVISAQLSSSIRSIRLIALTLILILAFHTFYPTYFILSLTLILFTLITTKPHQLPSCDHRITPAQRAYYHCITPLYLKSLSLSLLPIALSLVIVIPSILFFHTFTIAGAMSSYFNFTLTTYRDNLYHIFYYFARYDFLIPALLLKLVVIRHLWVNHHHPQTLKPPISKRQISDAHYLLPTTYCLLLFLTHILIIARTPFWFERYVIMVQPLISISIVTDLFFLTTHLSFSKLKSQLALPVALTALLIFSRYQLVTNHIYELTYQYQGPIDYLVTYIQDHSPHPESLTIATNFEEDSLMYYLGSRVIIGYAQAHLAADMSQNPDLIIIRKDTGGDHDLTPFTTFLSRALYQPINFPIYDYPINNNPALFISRPHLFKTLYTDNPQEQLTLLVRSDLYPLFSPSP